MTPSPEDLERRLDRARRERQRQGRQRRRRSLEALPGLRVRDGRRVLHNFSSNDYLGLADRPAEGAAGSGASALISGYRSEQRLLEAELAAFLGRESVILTSSGYLANLAALTALAGRGDTVVQDRLCHASLIDGARLSGATLKRYAHADASAAERRLEGAGGHRLIVTDGVFSMDGDTAPVGELAAVARRQDATLVVDDAHGIGVLGDSGGGLCEALGLGPDEVPVLIGTFGKAFGCAGAFIAGSAALIEHLENHARSVIYSTALPPVMVHAAREGLGLVRGGDELRNRLRQNIERFREGAAQRGIRLLPSKTPIQPLLLGDETTALSCSAELEARGFLVLAIRPPTVPAGSSRLRITLSAAHEEADLDGLLDALVEVLEPIGALA